MNSANTSQTIDCKNATNNDAACKEIDEDALAQFKIIIIVVFIALLCFLGFFVYNLIKCYLPKWRGREFQTVPNQSSVEQSSNNPSQIEFQNVS